MDKFIQRFFALAMVFGAINLTANDHNHIPKENQIEFSRGFGYYLEDMVNRNGIVSKYFSFDAFLIGFDSGIAKHPVKKTKEEICMYFEKVDEITDERKLEYSEACGHYVATLLIQKDSSYILFDEVRIGMVNASHDILLPTPSENFEELNSEGMYIELLTDNNEVKEKNLAIK